MRLYITGNGTDVTFAATGGTQLTFASGSGNILVSGAAGATIGNAASVALGSAPVIAFGSVEAGLMVNTGSDLAVDASLVNAANLTKSLGGDLTFNTRQYFNTAANYLTILDGTVTLNGGENTLWQGVQGGTAGQHLSIGANGTLNLNGNSQMVGDLRSPSSLVFVGAGGTITSSSAANFVTANAANSWGGQITGDIFYNKTGNSAITFQNDNTYSGNGGTLINGSTFDPDRSRQNLRLRRGRQNYARLWRPAHHQWRHGRLIQSPSTTSLPIISSGGTLNFTGRDNTASSETVGSVTLAEGLTSMTVHRGRWHGAIRGSHSGEHHPHERGRHLQLQRRQRPDRERGPPHRGQWLLVPRQQCPPLGERRRRRTGFL
ncbi:MAG: hypothetical protein WDN28_29180 [Chthoniobacter sp.]